MNNELTSLPRYQKPQARRLRVGGVTSVSVLQALPISELSFAYPSLSISLTDPGLQGHLRLSALSAKDTAGKYRVINLAVEASYGGGVELHWLTGSKSTRTNPTGFRPAVINSGDKPLLNEFPDFGGFGFLYLKKSLQDGIYI